MDGYRQGTRSRGHRRRWVFACSRVALRDQTQQAGVSVELTAGDAALLPLVKALGEFLTSEEDDLRSKGLVVRYLCCIDFSHRSTRLGVDFLSLVLARFPPEKLKSHSGEFGVVIGVCRKGLIVTHLVKVLVTFFRGKLDDTETIIPALRGLVALVAKPAFGSNDAIEVVRGSVLTSCSQSLF